MDWTAELIKIYIPELISERTQRRWQADVTRMEATRTLGYRKAAVDFGNYLKSANKIRSANMVVVNDDFFDFAKTFQLRYSEGTGAGKEPHADSCLLSGDEQDRYFVNVVMPWLLKETSEEAMIIWDHLTHVKKRGGKTMHIGQKRVQVSLDRLNKETSFVTGDEAIILKEAINYLVFLKHRTLKQVWNIPSSVPGLDRRKLMYILKTKLYLELIDILFASDKEKQDGLLVLYHRRVTARTRMDDPGAKYDPKPWDEGMEVLLGRKRRRIDDL